MSALPQPSKRLPTGLTGKAFIVSDKEPTLWEESAWDVYYIRSAWTNGETPTEHVTATGQQGSGLKTAPLPHPASPAPPASAPPPPKSAPLLHVTHRHKQQRSPSITRPIIASLAFQQCIGQRHVQNKWAIAYFTRLLPRPGFVRLNLFAGTCEKFETAVSASSRCARKLTGRFWRSLRKCRRASSLSPLQKNKEKIDKAEPPSGLAQSQQGLCLRFPASKL